MSRAKETICAVVVTYNRKHLLIECLEALRKQTKPVDAIYIVDNFSNDGTEKLLFDKGFINELPPVNLREPWEKEFHIKNLTDKSNIAIYYVRMHANTGGAGGFYEGVKRGYERGYNWLWLMDDDAEPTADCLLVLLTYDKPNIAILCPLILGYDGYQMYHHKKITPIFMRDKSIIRDVNKLPETIKIDANAFVGPLIKSDYIAKAGFPKKELFIWGDDTEYTYRLNKFGNIVLCKNAIIKHKNAFNNQTMSKEKIKREIYINRNRILFVKEFSFFNIPAYIYWILQACKSSVIIILKHKQFKAWIYPIKGIISGFFYRV